uniref:Rab-GAP TBC domain-containing protein n=1 Tax=Plectus sambesii TaxID=2011161 RepID=A0A914XLH4_9BILA
MSVVAPTRPEEQRRRRERVCSVASGEVVHVRAKKYAGRVDENGPNAVRFSVDPNLTTFEVLRDILGRAFQAGDRRIIIWYLVSRRTGEPDRYLPMLSDYDFNAATNFTPPNLFLKVDLRTSSSADDEEWSVLESDDLPSPPPVPTLPPASPETSPTSEAKPSALASWANRFASKLSLLTSAVSKTNDKYLLDTEEPTDQKSKEKPPLSDTQFRSFLDESGRLRDEKRFRQAVYQGGVEPSLRPVVWRFLLDVYPVGLTGEQRIEYCKALANKYAVQKASWQNRLKRGRFADEHLRYVANAVRKDVIRTDRSHPFFAGGGDDDNENVLALFNLLYTYALCHPSVGYCQGMSDLAAPLLVVMRDEADAYVCFCALMRRLRANFSCDGRSMTSKFNHLSRLLQFYDAVFFEYLRETHSDDLLFCYRWLLLELKREFVFDDALRVMETTWACMQAQPPVGTLTVYDVDLSLAFDVHHTPSLSVSVPVKRSESCDGLSTIREEEATLVESTALFAEAMQSAAEEEVAMAASPTRKLQPQLRRFLQQSRALHTVHSCPGGMDEGEMERERGDHGKQHDGVCHASVMRSLVLGGKADPLHSYVPIPSTISSPNLHSYAATRVLSYPPMKNGYGRLSGTPPACESCNLEPRSFDLNVNDEQKTIDRDDDDDNAFHIDSDDEGEDDGEEKEAERSVLGPMDLHLQALTTAGPAESERRLKPCGEHHVADNDELERTLSTRPGEFLSPVEVAQLRARAEDALSPIPLAREATHDEQDSRELTLADIYDICVAQTVFTDVSMSSSALSETRSRQVSGVSLSV